MRRLLQKLSAQEWALEHGGKHVYRGLIEGMLEHTRFANAADWLELLALPTEARDWTDADQSSLTSEFEDYCNEGIGDDRRNCSTTDEKSGLIDSLTELGKKTGRDFSKEIERLSDSIAEGEEEDSTEQSEISNGTSFAPSAIIVVTDDDVRQLFRTLKDE